MKVLHLLRQMNPGGIECWLDRLIRSWPQSRWPEFHIALETAQRGSLAHGLEEAGVKFHYLPPPRRGSSHLVGLWRLLRQHGPFQAIHCHNHYAAAVPIMIAAAAGVPVRIAHSHADLRHYKTGIARRLYRSAARRMVSRLATHPIAVSSGAAKDLFGSASDEALVLPCGIELDSLLRVDRRVEDDRFNLVHAGRLVPEKNHCFLLELYASLRKMVPKARLMLAGDGPERTAIESFAKCLGIADGVEFLGSVSDLKQLWAISTVFVFPSHSEGLGLAALEAQAAGVPCVVASHLPSELDVVPGLVQRLALDLPKELWVEAILKLAQANCPVTVREQAFARSGLSLAANCSALEKIYESREQSTNHQHRD